MKIINYNPSSSTSLIDLPIDIIINILNRLSKHSLFLFHYVCRLWRALLYSRQIACHIKKISDKKYTLMRNIDCSCLGSVICRFKIPVELQSTEFMLLEPINGILCIIGPILSHVTFVYLWNPLTNEFKTLPKPNVQMGFVAISFGFGFVHSTNDYKVVRVIQHERKDDSRVEIYSLNRNSWSRVRDTCSSSEITGNERDDAKFRNSAVVTVDLENEVITQTDHRYVSRPSPEADHRSQHCRTITWSYGSDAMLLTLPEDDLVLCKYGDSLYRSSTTFKFSGSLVSLNRERS